MYCNADKGFRCPLSGSGVLHKGLEKAKRVVAKASREAMKRDVDKETSDENANTGKTGRKKAKA